MPYEGEFAGYRSLKRIVDTERVQKLLNRAKMIEGKPLQTNIVPANAPQEPETLPAFVLAIDGSYHEVDVRTGYPGAKVGYVTVASVLLDLAGLSELDKIRPVDPAKFRTTEKASTIDSALPGSNVVTINKSSASESFRQEVYEVFNDIILDEVQKISLRSTYEALLAQKPQGNGQACPYKDTLGCDQTVVIHPGCNNCPCGKKTIFSTDALRIHERFRDEGSNGEAFGLLMQVWERVLLIHLLRCFEQQRLLKHADKLAFILDGPLAQFGPPAWLSTAINAELKRLNKLAKSETGSDLIILGIEKTGNFVSHFEEIDKTLIPGESRFSNRSYLLPTDAYIKERITFSESDKRYGADTYFGRKVFYKSKSGARIVMTIPFLDDSQDTLESQDISLYPQFGMICALLDKLVSSRIPNSVSPILTAHAHAAIPLHLGAKVLTSLAQALMRNR